MKNVLLCVAALCCFAVPNVAKADRASALDKLYEAIPLGEEAQLFKENGDETNNQGTSLYLQASQDGYPGALLQATPGPVLASGLSSGNDAANEAFNLIGRGDGHNDPAARAAFYDQAEAKADIAKAHFYNASQAGEQYSDAACDNYSTMSDEINTWYQSGQ